MADRAFAVIVDITAAEHMGNVTAHYTVLDSADDVVLHPTTNGPVNNAFAEFGHADNSATIREKLADFIRDQFADQSLTVRFVDAVGTF